MNIYSFSGGKDSTAMVINAVRQHQPVDAVVFCDTGGEFDEIYAHVEVFNKWCVDKGIGGG
jgi:3'-phosphoadenosine 5'-phosphosulfate sulfotransferase (PAPS reductase)/FAD synthetase